VLANVRQTPRPLRCTLVDAHHRLPLHRHLASTLADPVAALLHVPVLLDPGCAWSSAAWPLADAHRRLCLHASSHASSALFFSRKVLRLPIRKEEGGGWIFILQNGYCLRPKMFTPFDFFKSHLTIRLIQKICENVKIIMIYLKYILW
jgi:hypothetical protein